jgi:hypothetical protein
MAPELLEVVGVDADARRIEAVAEHDRREAAVAPERRDLLADDVARLGRERWTSSSGHEYVGSSESSRRGVQATQGGREFSIRARIRRLSRLDDDRRRGIGSGFDVG